MTADAHFSRIVTQSELDVTRYARAIRAYAGALLHPDDDAADEVADEFVKEVHRGGPSLRWLRYPPPRLLFRRFLKRKLGWAVKDYRRQKERELRRFRRFTFVLDFAGLPDDEPPPEQEADAVWDAESEREKIEAHREAIRTAWRQLEDFEREQKQNVFFTLAKLKVEHPGAKAEELAERLTELAGRPFNDNNVRQRVLKMREKLAGFVVKQVKQLLTPAELADLVDRETFQEELRDLRLMGYLRFPPPSTDATKETRPATEEG